MAVTKVISAFLPNRAYRRSMAGARCHLCGLGIVAVDLALVELELDRIQRVTQPIHTQCTALLADLAAEVNVDAEEPDGVPSEADPA